MKERLINATKMIFSWVTLILMGVFVLILAVYLVLLCVGGDTALKLNEFISTAILPKMYVVSVVTSFTGLFNMYLRGIKAFTLESGTGSKSKRRNRNDLQL